MYSLYHSLHLLIAVHFLYMFLGRPIRHCGYASLRVLRLFRHKLGRYEKMPTNADSITSQRF